ncbi:MULTISPECIES: ABC transporter ATP-binding protein [unclassified Shinella]|uniref:ABC transporter ATP-binding protein n=1 Tax=unclassified Shinella TaxID=2643062 RepID=UPI00234FB433|nr:MULTISPECIES: ABC transporter ATP-binding protein [unclassified Shinella]MCO5151126.1 ABC transporter ATP-binding protein [Shinella sp.]MDC7265975.1 ABC transporter ATP-binding protein [Shinella sp. HY16]MDC7272872.1 ABC transporter ATP-binding protein [Shinella sp. YZ44]
MMLSVRDLRVSFRTEDGLVRAIDGVSFDLDEGEILGVVGESGSGKTVSLLAVMGLITDPNATIEGSIRYKGRELVGLPARELRRLRGREIAMIFQDPMTALTPVYTIGWQIAEQIRAHEAISKAKALERVEALLAEVNFPNPREAMSRYPHQLSGGMRQRAVIAMALSCNPALLVADEPTTALDVTVQAGILDLVRKLRATHNSAVVFITHDMGVVSELADRVMVMYAGRVVERGNRAALFSDPRHPYTRALLGSIPPLNGEKPHRLPAIPGSPPSLLRLPRGCAFGPRCPLRYEPCLTEKPVLPAGLHAAACLREVQA